MPIEVPELDVVLADAGACLACQKRKPVAGALYCKQCAGLKPEARPRVEDVTKQELAARELCRRRLLAYVKRFKPDYLAGWFHVDLASRLDRFRKAVEEKQSPCMIINCPPRHGKTELASRGAPSQWLGLHPDWHIVAATHSGPLAIDNSRDVLAYIKDPKYRVLFPGVGLSREAQGATGWRTNKGGRYKPVGTDSGVSGYGGHVFIIDDPHKDNEAYSDTVLDKIWRWYKGSAATRMMPGGGKLIIQTRWGSGDLTGRVLEEEGRIEEGGKWEVVCYPAQATCDEYRTPSGIIVSLPTHDSVLLRRKGEYLHPERYDEDYFEQHKKDPVIWAALFQQNPNAGDAALFNEAMFVEKTLDDIPEGLIHYTAWDTAVATAERNTFTVGVTGGVDQNDNLWIVDMKRDRYNSLELIELLIDNYLEFEQDLIGIEKTHLAVAIEPFLNKRIDERAQEDARVARITIADLEHGNEDKAARARPIQARMQQRKVIFPKDAPWYPALKKELLDFPGGRWKDIVDAMAWLGQMIDEMRKPKGSGDNSGARASRMVKPKPSWRARLKIDIKTRDWRAA